jgi:hypothetical protein
MVAGAPALFKPVIVYEDRFEIVLAVVFLPAAFPRFQTKLGRKNV